MANPGLSSMSSRIINHSALRAACALQPTFNAAKAQAQAAEAGRSTTSKYAAELSLKPRVDTAVFFSLPAAEAAAQLV